MKYIRGQDGCIYSVSRLMPPCEGHPEGGTVWRMSVITVDGNECVYAMYSTEKRASFAYFIVKGFMCSSENMLVFELSVDGEPIFDQVVQEETMSASATAGGPSQTTAEICPPSNPEEDEVWTDPRTGKKQRWTGLFWVPENGGSE